MAETERLRRQRLSSPQIAHVLGMAVSTMGIVRRRLAYTEILPSEREEDTTAFLERAVAIGPWTHSYNLAKAHAGLKGRTPLQSVNNLRVNDDEAVARNPRGVFWDVAYERADERTRSPEIPHQSGLWLPSAILLDRGLRCKHQQTPSNRQVLEKDRSLGFVGKIAMEDKRCQYAEDAESCSHLPQTPAQQ